MSNPVYRRAVELLEAELGEDLVALEPQEGLCFGFNDVARNVWQTLSTPKSFEEIKAGLLEEYEVDHDQCARELAELLRDMREKGLIEIQPPAEPQQSGGI